MRKVTLVYLALILAASVAIASVPTGLQGVHVADGRYENNVLTSTGLSSAKADTVYLLGGPGAGTGKFQNDINPTLPDDEGWIGVDITAKTAYIWHIDTFNAPAGGNAIWCGEVFVACGGADTAEGYGNSYQEQLDWSGTVADNGVATNMTVTFDLNYDNEPGYDYLYLRYEGAAGMTNVATYNGVGTGTAISVPFTVASTDLLGPGLNEVRLRFAGVSDGAWSDADCLWPTNGLAQIDNITVSGTNGIVSTIDDFESGMIASNWQVTFPLSVGDFSKIWPNLNTIDPCNYNPTPQAAFIDDGNVVPCTGGTLGTTWTYGPGSFTHNLQGGCAGPTFHAENEIWSPVLAWEEAGLPIGGTHAGCDLWFEVYNHLPVGNGMFYVFHVRSSADNGASWTGWADRNFVYYGSGSNIRVLQTVTDLLINTPTDVQIALGVNELGWIWGLEGTDGTPAPYFDNIALTAYKIAGPAITTRELQLAQDNFPAIGDIDYVNLGNNSIRFDMANDINGGQHPGIQPGDSITFTVTAVAPGAVLNARPELRYTIKANPLFDPFRTAPITGSVLGDTAFTTTGVPVPDVFGFDLPDTGLLFPGDIMHYYIFAEDLVGGVVTPTTLPADPVLNGYNLFPGDVGFNSFDWSSAYTVHGLPTMFSAIPGDQPPMLFYNDFGGRGGENEWVGALNNLGYVQGEHYDVYYTNAPSSGVSNGLGARATLPQIEGYGTMLYTFGNLSSFGLNPYDQASDKSDDISLLGSWLSTGSKNLLATGDNLVSDLINNAGTVGAGFVSTWLGVQYVAQDISPVIGGQTAPLVKHVVGNPVALNTDFIAYGSCPGLNTFDEVAATTATEIAEWTDAAGNPIADGVTTAAAGFDYHPGGGTDVVYFPVDLMYWFTPEGYVSPSGAPFAARVDALDEILRHFGSIAPGGGTGAGELPAVFSARNFPNPFNPSTEIKWSIPRAGDLSIKVFNVRGELVKTLVDGTVSVTSGTELWNGLNDSGAQVASGVYFYEVRSGSNVVVNKMALVK